jgi:hypothetical protein
MRVRVENTTDYPDAEVRRLVRAVIRDMEVNDVHVKVRQRRDGHVTGRYRNWWTPGDGEDRPVITASLPKPGVELAAYMPYERRDAPPAFDLADWREALVAIVAHEAMHHRQTPRNGFRSSRKVKGGRRRYVESECDWAAYRMVRLYRRDTP